VSPGVISLTRGIDQSAGQLVVTRVCWREVRWARLTKRTQFCGPTAASRSGPASWNRDRFPDYWEFLSGRRCGGRGQERGLIAVLRNEANYL
jgi:hypothetical protein